MTVPHFYPEIQPFGHSELRGATGIRSCNEACAEASANE